MISMQELMKVPRSGRDLKWLQDSLQSAIQVELTTIPPYLTALWSIKDNAAANSALAYGLIREIVVEEMLHMGLACNMLSALGRDPEIGSSAVAPVYPGPLPGGIHPGLKITPARLSDASLEKFLVIEYPKDGPIALFWSAGQRYATIGDFYADVRAAFDDPNVKLPNPFHTSKQLTSNNLATLTVIHSKKEAQDAIDLITHQGEGTNQTPYAAGTTVGSLDDLAHYYKFGVLYHKHEIRKNPDPHAPLPYDYMGPAIPVPGAQDIYPMADVPYGGFQASAAFDKQYSQLLKQLQDAWREGTVAGSANLDDLITGGMFDLTNAARALLSKGLQAPGGMGIVGPSFQFGL